MTTTHSYAVGTTSACASKMVPAWVQKPATAIQAATRHFMVGIRVVGHFLSRPATKPAIRHGRQAGVPGVKHRKRLPTAEGAPTHVSAHGLETLWK